MEKGLGVRFLCIFFHPCCLPLLSNTYGYFFSPSKISLYRSACLNTVFVVLFWPLGVFIFCFVFLFVSSNFLLPVVLFCGIAVVCTWYPCTKHAPLFGFRVRNMCLYSSYMFAFLWLSGLNMCILKGQIKRFWFSLPPTKTPNVLLYERLDETSTPLATFTMWRSLFLFFSPFSNENNYRVNFITIVSNKTRIRIIYREGKNVIYYVLQ